MNALNRFAEIADLVNSWADRLEKDDRGMWPDRPKQIVVLDEMRAFSNGLSGTIDTFRPAVDAAERMVAERNNVRVELRTDGGTILQRNVLPDTACWAISFKVPAGFYIVEASYPNRYPPMVPEEV